MKKSKETKTLIIVNFIAIGLLVLLYYVDFLNTKIHKPIILFLCLGIISLAYSKKPLLFAFLAVEILLIAIYFLYFFNPNIVKSYFFWVFY
jgi:hypothetical protein